MSKFWQDIHYLDLSDSLWEDLCDRCGLCCFQQFITGYGKRTKYTKTKICCNLYDVENHCCSDYINRKSKVYDCFKLTKHNIVKASKWLPQTCSYRLVLEGKDLPEWHYLKTGSFKSLEKANVCRKFGIHESQVILWEDWIIE